MVLRYIHQTGFSYAVVKYYALWQPFVRVVTTFAMRGTVVTQIAQMIRQRWCFGPVLCTLRRPARRRFPELPSRSVLLKCGSWSKMKFRATVLVIMSWGVAEATKTM